jgi:sugar (pentulose or hexulose) kinase
MNNEKLILAVDLGTSGMKVALITISGKVLGWESEPVRLIKFSDIPQLVQFQKSYQPQAKHRTLYDERFNIFKQIYKQMKGIHHRLNG